MKLNCTLHGNVTRMSLCRYLASCASALAIILVAGCGGEQGAWKSAQQNDAIAGYKQYLVSYPKGEHADAAKARMSSLWLDMMQTPQFAQKFAGVLQVGTQLKTGDENSYMERDENGQIVSFPMGTTLTVMLADTDKKDRTASIKYAYVSNFGGAALFRSEEHGALILLFTQILIPLPTWQEIETEDVSNIVLQWKATMLSNLSSEIAQEKVENMRENPQVYALIPLPSSEKLLKDSHFRKMRSAKAILETRMKLLAAIEEAGSIKIPSQKEDPQGKAI